MSFYIIAFTISNTILITVVISLITITVVTIFLLIQNTSFGDVLQ